MWTWISGSNQLNQPPIYGKEGEPQSEHNPGSRASGCLWEAENGTLWLFGGSGIALNGNNGKILSMN